ncbi:MAG: PQQ-binding-like beta-propeller repeat protein [bacterium]|nr:PQQ-binding-like beta-propeller repeat protein [bacterium]
MNTLKRIGILVLAAVLALPPAGCGSKGKQGSAGENGTSINWLGSSSTAPSSPRVDDAYYNTADGKSYIWDGSAWQILTENGVDGIQGPAGLDGISIKWLGSLPTAPSAPGVNDAYHDTTLGVSLIWDGSAWQTLAENGAVGLQGPQGLAGINGTNGTNGTNGISINWKGSFSSAPANPSLNDAYYSTTDKTSYIWGGTSWQILAKDGATGPQGLQGTVGPQGPAGTSGTNGTNGINGTNGTNGTNGISISWLGSYAGAPFACSTAKLNNAYYDTVALKSYVCDGAAWQILAQDGASGGSNGTSILWLGSYADRPVTCDVAHTNNAYYDSVRLKSYVCDGAAWQILAQDGAAGAQGSQGDPGSQGPQGAEGPQGVPGPTMPVIQSLSVFGVPANPGGSVTVAVAAQSAAGLGLVYKWHAGPAEWLIAGGQGTSIVNITAPSTYAASGTASVTVTDTEGRMAVGTVVLTTAGNLAPVISAITASPNPVEKQGSTTITVTANDPNGDGLNYVWSVPTDWSITGGDGTAQITVSAPDQYSNNGIATVTVSDGQGGSVDGSIAVATVANLAPVIASVGAYPGMVAKGGTVTLGATATDPNGDSLACTWYVPAGWVITSGQGTNVVTVQAPDAYSNGGWALVSVKDGYGGNSLGGVGVSTVGNLPPVIESITIYPQPATAADFVCDAQDPYGDTLDYAWTVGGVYPSVVTGASWYWYSPGIPGYYRVGVTVDDGYGGTASGSSFMNVSSGSPWPKFRRDIQSTGASPYAGPVTNTLKWSYATGGASGMWSSPAIGADGTVYIGALDNNFWAIKPDGSYKWNINLLGAVSSSPAIGADGTIYVGANNKRLWALYPSGISKWAYIAGGDVQSSPAIGADGTIYFSSNDAYFYALNPDGTLKWTVRTGTGYTSSPAIGADGTIYVGGSDTLYAVDPYGTIKWSYPTLNRLYASPAVGADGTIYIGSEDQYFYAVKPDGTLKWSYFIGGVVYSAPAITADETIYVSSLNNNLYALGTDGTLKWTYKTGGELYSSPAVGADGTIYVGSRDNRLHAINPDGTCKWRHTVGGWVQSSPAIGNDGTIYFGSFDKSVYAIK